MNSIDFNEYIGKNMNTLSDTQAEKLEGLLTLQEISLVLKNMKNDKSRS